MVIAVATACRRGLQFVARDVATGSFFVWSRLLMFSVFLGATAASAQTQTQYFQSYWDPSVRGSCEAMRMPVVIALLDEGKDPPGCTPSFLLPYVSTSISNYDGDCYYGVTWNNWNHNAVVSPQGYSCAGVGGAIAGTKVSLACAGGIWGGVGTICTTYKEPLSCPLSTPFPITLATGNKGLREVDVAGQTSGEASLRWERFFNGLLLHLAGPHMSSYWTHSFSYYLQLYDSATVYVVRPNGAMFGAASPGAATAAGLQRWTTDSDVVEQVYQQINASLQATGWLVVASDGSVESYDPTGNLLSIEDQRGRYVVMAYSSGTAGYALDANWKPTSTLLPVNLLVQVTDSFGRSLSLGYNTGSQLVQLTDPSGLNYRYTYDNSGNLASVIYPDGKTRQYLYSESAYTGGASLPNSLTGIVDENGTRFASYWYNSSGQATQEVLWADSAQTKAVGQYVVTLNSNGTTTMTDPLNSQATFGFQTINGVHFGTSQSQPAGAGCGPASSSSAYDANGNATSRQDFNGNLTTYTYDTSRNLETQRTEAYGTGQARTISTQWHPTFRVRTAEAAPLKITHWIYNGQPDPTNGNATASCAPTAFVVNEPGALLHFDGTNGSTTFTDVLGHTFTSSNGAALSTANFKFGTGSLGLNGSNQSISTPSSTDFDLQGDFTIEAWVYYNAGSTSAAQTLVSRDDGSGSQNKWGFGVNVLSAGNFSLHRNGSGNSNLNWPWAPNANTWYHLAIVRQSNNWTVYVNGTSLGTVVDTNPMPLTTAPLVIGALGEGLWYTNGYIDEMRITSGTAVYTANFTPPTAPLNPVTAQVPNLLVNGAVPAVLCKEVEQATTDATGAAGFGATATGSPRLWTYTYNAYGQVLTATGPRGNLATSDPNYAASTTTYQYYATTDTAHAPPHYQAGDLQQVTDPAGHVTQYLQYDGNGRVLQQVDPNGTTTSFTYYPRGWLQTRTVTPPGSSTSQSTSYVYDGGGQIKQVTQPDGSQINYVYDAAHRLTQITDSAGDSINYTLDGMGNRTLEQVKDPSGNLARQVSRVYDALNRLQTITGALQ
jgi:YD repeat-containing protein